jgi:ABC-type transport system substrate-binding protein
VAQQIGENLGVNVAVDSVSWVTHLARVEKKQWSPMVMGSWVPDFPDPDGFLRVAPIQERSGWHNETYDRLLEEARRTMVQKERISLYHQAEKILMEEAPIMPLTYSAWHTLVRPWLRGFTPRRGDVSSWKDVVIEQH